MSIIHFKMLNTQKQIYILNIDPPLSTGFPQ